MKYQPEVDGLRAIAVVSVVLSHAGLPYAAGGFIGVDVFFVISGYLITTLVTEELGNGRFSMWRFYERRARRLLPASLFVMVVSIPFGYSNGKIDRRVTCIWPTSTMMSHSSCWFYQRTSSRQRS